MKKASFSFLLLLTFFAVSAQNPAYEKTMTDLALKIQSSEFEIDLQPFANKLERIAAAEDAEWLPNYWVAFCYMRDSFKQGESAEQDQYLEHAEVFIEKAETLTGQNNAEVKVLKAQIASARMSIDPMNRYQTYGQVFSSSLENAKQIDPENPRIYYLEATSAFYTPENFGGGKEVAKPLFEKALEKFENFEIENEMHPNWGFNDSHYFLSQIN